MVELQVSVEAPPLTTTDGFATNVAVGMTLTSTLDTLLVRPVPVHVNEYELGIVSAPVLCEPLAPFVPLQLPEAVHEVAFVELQVKVDALPLGTDVGFAVSVTVAAGTTVTEAVATLLVPPPPVQVNE